MRKVTGQRRLALEMMAGSTDGKIDMTRGRAPFRDATINSLERDGLVLWCDIDACEPQSAIITPAGRAALEGE